jgi:hypothetical protein
MRMDQKYILLLFLIGLIELFALLLFISPDYMKEEFNQEKALLTDFMGADVSDEIYLTSQDIYRNVFVDSGIVQTTVNMFTADVDIEDGYGSAQLGNDVNNLVSGRIEAFWIGIMFAIFRVSIFLNVFLYAGLLYIPFLVDALVQRRINQLGFIYASPNIYHASKSILVGAFILPFVFMLWPGAISPLIYLAWSALFPCCLWFGGQNVQHAI